MEYISAEEFLKQPKEVQEVFIGWWENNSDSYDLVVYENHIEYISFYGDIEFGENYYTKLIPLLTEGQIRKFIEDKVGYIDINLNSIEDGIRSYDIECYPFVPFEGFKNSREFNNIVAPDLLQAYWQVAVQIAEEK